MVYVTSFRCFRCSRQYKPEEIEKLPIPRCSNCGSALDAEYDYSSIQKIILRDDFMRDKPAHWKYWAFMPVKDLSKIITMGEGGTPLLENRRLWKRGRLLIKYEASNPTGSFKDRGSSLEITKALEFGKPAIGAQMAADVLDGEEPDRVGHRAMESQGGDPQCRRRREEQNPVF